jgi:hypothetical protein
MCFNPVPVPTACPTSVTMLVAQIKDLPRAQQQEILEQLHNHVYQPFYAVLVAGPDYRPHAG